MKKLAEREREGGIQSNFRSWPGKTGREKKEASGWSDDENIEIMK